MTQTLKDQNDSTQKRGRPGQRQQERLERIARRRHRQRVALSIVALILLAALVGVGFWQYQKYTDAQTALQNKHATATAAVQNTHATATATVCLPPTLSAGPTTPPPVTTAPAPLGSDGLQYIDINKGCDGRAVQNGSAVAVQYTGWLQSGGKKFDSSYDHGGQPFTVTVGQGQVIKGWEEGLVGMKTGSTRRLIIPPTLGYGAAGSPPVIPPNATLIFDVTVVSIQ